MSRIKYALQQAFNWNRKELNMFLVSSLMAGFLVSFRMWGVDQTAVDVGMGLSNFMLYSVFFALFYFLFIATQKFVATILGYDCKFELWKYGPVIAFFITIYLVLLFPAAQFVVFLYLGTVTLKVVPRLKLGAYWPGLNARDLMLIGVAGPLFLVIFMIVVLLPPYVATHSDFTKNLLYVAGLIVFFTSLPMPNTNGISILMFSRKLWLFYFGFGLFFLWLIWSFTALAAIMALVLALMLVFVATKFSESHF